MGLERKVISIRLEEDFIQELKDLAEQENRPLSNFIETVLKKHVAAHKSEKA